MNAKIRQQKQTGDKIKWRTKEKQSDAHWKNSFCKLINPDVQPQRGATTRNISVDMTRGGTLPSPAERSHTDVRRPNTVEQKSTRICLHISVTSAHVPRLNAHIPRACRRDIKPGTLIRRTHTVLTFEPPTTRLAPLANPGLLLSDVLTSSALSPQSSLPTSASGSNSRAESCTLRWARAIKKKKMQVHVGTATFCSPSLSQLVRIAQHARWMVAFWIISTGVVHFIFKEHPVCLST